jgi:hypothetical protein
MACPKGSIRFTGIKLLGNCLPVVGSIMEITLPSESLELEKSPLRSACVGIFAVAEVVGTFIRVYSWLQKKKNKYHKQKPNIVPTISTIK